MWWICWTIFFVGGGGGGVLLPSTFYRKSWTVRHYSLAGRSFWRHFARAVWSFRRWRRREGAWRSASVDETGRWLCSFVCLFVFLLVCFFFFLLCFFDPVAIAVGWGSAVRTVTITFVFLFLYETLECLDRVVWYWVSRFWLRAR